MIDMYDLYQSFKSYVNTYVGGWFRPGADFVPTVNDISTMLFVEWTRQAEKSQEAKDNLLPFLISKNMIVSKSGATGTFKVPSDKGKEYSRFGAARLIVAGNTCVPCKEVDDGKCANGEFESEIELAENYYDTIKQVQVDMIETQKWGSVMEHLTKGPTLSKPKIRQINEGFEVAPRGVSVIVLDYYRQPKKATMSYTITTGNIDTGAGDDMVYNPKLSQPLEWPENLRNEFLINLGERYGMFTRDQFMYNATNQQKQTA
jgi:hypothetical protein